MSTARKIKHANPTAIVGAESTVDDLVRAHAAKSAAEDRISAARAILDPLAVAERADLESRAVVTKQVTIKGTGTDARYTFPDAYKPLPVGLAADLAGTIGDTFGALFRREIVATLRPGVIDALAEILGPRAHEFIDATPVIVAVEDFGEARALARRALSDAQNAALDHVVGLISQSPRCTVK